MEMIEYNLEDKEQTKKIKGRQKPVQMKIKDFFYQVGGSSNRALI